jgi:ribosome assembly protein RRB1
VVWHPFEPSQLAVSSADNSVSIWDMALENDPEAVVEGAQLDAELPPQLLFVHQGQTNIKEVHFHPQVKHMIISTAQDGIDFFKPDNLHH